VAFRFAGFALDVDARRLIRAGVDIHLTPKAFDLLALLLAAAPRVVPKVELHARLWPDSFVSEATLASLVKEVRKALGTHHDTDEIVRTVTRVGYACAALVERTTITTQGVRRWLVADDKAFPLQQGPNVVGREPDSSVWLDDGSVSRRHARITIADDARLEDLGSKNGTKVNAERVVAPVLLRDGDQVAIGSVVLVYRCSASGLSTETSEQ
jgi:DNA-binding winged helix-turn-helix (wHTH) protein